MAGWEPSETTRYEYDSDGRLVASVVTREPEWDQYQLSLLKAAERLSADIGPHGQPMSEATSPDADPATLGGHRYVVNDNPIIDRAQQALDRKRSDWERAHPKADTSGHVWRVRKVEN